MNFPSITITVVGGSCAVFYRTLRDDTAIDGVLEVLRRTWLNGNPIKRAASVRVFINRIYV